MLSRSALTISLRSVAITGALVAALPALAQPSPPPPPPPGTIDADGRVFNDAAPVMIPAPPPPMAPAYAQSGYPAQGGYDRAAWDRARADWLDECRANHRPRGRGNTIGGALVGGLVGGIVGNAVAGHGDKTLGTVAGAAVGAAAGGALGSSADRRNEARAMDYCEAYLERHLNYGYGQPGYGYAYQPMTVMVPVAMVPVQPVTRPAPAQPRECKETQVIEEWVPVAGPARRYIPRRPAPAKRIYRAPDKRIPID